MFISSARRGGGGLEWPARFVGFVLLLLLVSEGAEARARDKGARSEYSGERVDTIFRRDGERLHERPNWVALVAPVGNGSLPARVSDQYLCPNGSHYATRHGYAPRAFGSSVTMTSVPNFLLDFIIGCCEIGTFACTLPGVDRVLGCCPVGTRCAYRRTGNNPFHSCVAEVSQECGTRRCNPGYVCCPGKDESIARCVPGDAHAPLEEACGKPRTFRARGSTDRLSASRPGSTRPHLLYDRARPEGFNGTRASFRGENTTVDYTLGLYRCSITRELCSFNDTCALVPQFSSSYNVTTGALIATTTTLRATTCCPEGWQVCFRPGAGGAHVPPPASVSSVGGGTVGCADVNSGEACCGAAICPAGGKCCMPQAAAVGSPAVTTAGRERASAEPVCCSESDQCCYSPLRGVFCGKTINGKACAADSRAPGVWYNQHGALSATLLP